MDNKQFLANIFGDQHDKVLVTRVSGCPTQASRSAWTCEYFNDSYVEAYENQYFCISLFNYERRLRKDFTSCPAFVIDDVSEKVSGEDVIAIYGYPSWALQTSAVSQQYGYLFDEPVTDPEVIERMQDYAVEKLFGNVDPGMKGVTRIVRLPGGWNLKSNRDPYKCQLIETNFKRHPVGNFPLSATSTPSSKQGQAADVDDHPILTCGITVKHRKSDGKYEVECPWVEEHTLKDGDGTIVYTNVDGTIGFKCHHGHCQHRTAVDVLKEFPDLELKMLEYKIDQIAKEGCTPQSVGDVLKMIVSVGGDRTTHAPQIKQLADLSGNGLRALQKMLVDIKENHDLAIFKAKSDNFVPFTLNGALKIYDASCGEVYSKSDFKSLMGKKVSDLITQQERMRLCYDRTAPSGANGAVYNLRREVDFSDADADVGHKWLKDNPHFHNLYKSLMSKPIFHQVEYTEVDLLPLVNSGMLFRYHREAVQIINPTWMLANWRSVLLALEQDMDAGVGGKSGWELELRRIIICSGGCSVTEAQRRLQEASVKSRFRVPVLSEIYAELNSSYIQSMRNDELIYTSDKTEQASAYTWPGQV